MGISSEDARSIQFSGSEHAYDASEVEDFRKRVVDALGEYEAGVAETPGEEDLASAQRVRQQAVALAERMLLDVMGSSADDTGGLEAFQEAAMLHAVAEDELLYAQEESRRLTAIAFAERDAIRARYAQERRELRAELQRELQVSRDAAAAEAASIQEAAREEATDIVRRAAGDAQAAKESAVEDAKRLERRLGVLHTALGDAEGRFRRLAATAANDLGTLEAIVNREDTAEAEASPVVPVVPTAPMAAIDLTDNALEETGPRVEEAAGEPGMIEKDPDVGFYQRRLAGLRDRLEKSGHPPE